MATPPLPSGATWAASATALAARVNRRARLAAGFRRLGWALLVAAALAFLWRALGGGFGPLTAPVGVGAVLLAGFLVGLPWALRAARAAPEVSDADAAWALDRLADAGGRGLAAAATVGPAASEAAFAGTPLGPPLRVRLLPPGGLLPVLGAGVLSALALLAPGAGEDASKPGFQGSGGNSTTSSGATASADGEEAEARALDAKAATRRRVRQALNLPAEGTLDPQEVAKALADPERRRAAAAAAGSGTDLGDALGQPKTPGQPEQPGNAVARLLDPGEDNGTRASEHRRRAAGARAGRATLAVPAARREVVSRYLQLID